MITLRPYQKTALERIEWALSNLDGNNLCVLPTGSGKSVVIAELANKLSQDILILQPSKEILIQNKNKLALYVNPEEISVYSASLNEKEVKKYTFATIGSIKDYELFKHFKIVIVDEAHLINPKKEDSMYSSFFSEIGNPKVIGFTATPYRIFPTYFRDAFGGFYQKSSIKLINRIKPLFWDRIIYNVNNKDLLSQGFLSPLKYEDKTLFLQNQLKLNKSETDFDLENYETALQSKKAEIQTVIDLASKKFKHLLVFCSTISQAEWLSKEFSLSAYVTSKSSAEEREEIIEKFKKGDIKIVFNVGVLTTGFDFPALDCIILLRPTQSIALYYQMLGRGVRLSEGKEFCQVIDFTNTVQKLGKIETIELQKVNNKWELITETGNDWHGKELYTRKLS